MKANDAALKVYGYKRTNRLKAYAVKNIRFSSKKIPASVGDFLIDEGGSQGGTSGKNNHIMVIGQNGNYKKI